MERLGKERFEEGWRRAAEGGGGGAKIIQSLRGRKPRNLKGNEPDSVLQTFLIAHSLGYHSDLDAGSAIGVRGGYAFEHHADQ